jgi:4-hydroxy-tetrahydrodipicolinate reductase
MIKVGVLGANGRMGSEVCRTVAMAGDMEVAAAADVGDDRGPLADCDVIVDFTHPGAVMDNLRWCIAAGRNVVVGTSGFDDARLAAAGEWLGQSPEVRVLIAANFSVGAVLMMRFAQEAARFFESAEIIELHHAGKADAPSGTAARTAALIAAARSSADLGPSPDATVTAADGARGAVLDGVHVHSVRLSGLVAHQEVLLGGHGEVLTLRHDSLDRASFMPGVLLGIRGVAALPAGLTFGLETLLGVD